MAPTFLSLEEILHVHADQIERYGGSAGIRDLNLLQSAIAMPQSGFGDAYFHSDLFEMAAAYLYHIIQNHPFIDGNKRVGVAAALVFLKLNNVALTVTNPALVKIALDAAEGKIGKSAVAEFFRKHAQR